MCVQVILKEREERKRQRLYDEQEVMSPVSSAESQLLPGPANITDSDFSQDGTSINILILHFLNTQLFYFTYEATENSLNFIL